MTPNGVFRICSAAVVVMAILASFTVHAFVQPPYTVSSLNSASYQFDGSERKATRERDPDIWPSEGSANDNNNNNKRVSKAKKQLGFGKTHPTANSKSKDRQQDDGDTAVESSQIRTLWYADLVKPSEKVTARPAVGPKSGSSAAADQKHASSSDVKVDSVKELSDSHGVDETTMTGETDKPQDQSATLLLSKEVSASTLASISENSASTSEQKIVDSSVKEIVKAQDSRTKADSVKVVSETGPDVLPSEPASALESDGASGLVPEMQSSPRTNYVGQVKNGNVDIAQYMKSFESKTKFLDDKFAVLRSTVGKMERSLDTTTSKNWHSAPSELQRSILKNDAANMAPAEISPLLTERDSGASHDPVSLDIFADNDMTQGPSRTVARAEMVPEISVASASELKREDTELEPLSNLKDPGFSKNKHAKKNPTERDHSTNLASIMEIPASGPSELSEEIAFAVESEGANPAVDMFHEVTEFNSDVLSAMPASTSKSIEDEETHSALYMKSLEEKLTALDDKLAGLCDAVVMAEGQSQQRKASQPKEFALPSEIPITASIPLDSHGTALIERAFIRKSTTSSLSSHHSQESSLPGMKPIQRRSLPVDAQGQFTSGETFLSGSQPLPTTTSRSSEQQATSFANAHPGTNLDAGKDADESKVATQTYVAKDPSTEVDPGKSDDLSAIPASSFGINGATFTPERDTAVTVTTETDSTQHIQSHGAETKVSEDKAAVMIQMNEANKKAARSISFAVDSPNRFHSGDVFSSGSPKHSTKSHLPLAPPLPSDRQKVSLPDPKKTIVSLTPDRPDAYLPGSPRPAAKPKLVQSLPVDLPGTFSSGDAFIRGAPPRRTTSTSQTRAQQPSRIVSDRQESSGSVYPERAHMGLKSPLHVEQAAQTSKTVTTSQQQKAGQPQEDSGKALFAAEKLGGVFPTQSPQPASNSSAKYAQALEMKVKVLDDKLAALLRKSDALKQTHESPSSVSSNTRPVQIDESQNNSVTGTLEKPESPVQDPASSAEDVGTLESKVKVLVDKIAAMRKMSSTLESSSRNSQHIQEGQTNLASSSESQAFSTKSLADFEALEAQMKFLDDKLALIQTMRSEVEQASRSTNNNSQEMPPSQPDDIPFNRPKAYPLISLPVDRLGVIGDGSTYPAESSARNRRQQPIERDQEAAYIEDLEAKMDAVERKLAAVKKMGNAIEEATHAARNQLGQPNILDKASNVAYVEALEAKLGAIDEKLATMHQISHAADEAARGTRKRAGQPSSLAMESQDAYIEALEAKMDALDDKLAAMHQMSHTVEEATRAMRKRAIQATSLEDERQAAYAEALEAKIGDLDDKLVAIHQMSHAVEEATRAATMQIEPSASVAVERHYVEDLERKLNAIDDKLAAIHQMEVAVEEASRSTQLRERQIASQYAETLVAKMNALDDQLAALQQMSFSVEEAARSQENSLASSKASLKKSLAKSLTVDSPGAFPSGDAFVKGLPPPRPAANSPGSRAFQQAVDVALDRRPGFHAAGGSRDRLIETPPPSIPRASDSESKKTWGPATKPPALFRSLAVDTPSVFNDRPDWKN